MESSDSPKGFQNISLKTLRVLENFFKNIDDGQDGVDIISETLEIFINEITKEEALISHIVLFTIIKAVSDEMELTFEEFQDRILYPVSMNLLEYNYVEE